MGHNHKVRANPDKPWDWKALSTNLSITSEVVRANLDKPWNTYYLSLNPSKRASVD